MKRLITAILFLVACSNSTEKQIRKAVTSIEKSTFEKEGHRLESLKIDSIDYTMLNQSQYYERLETDLNNQEMELSMDMIESLKYAGSDSAKMRISANLKEQNNKFKRMHDNLENLIKTSDTSIKIYRVKYYSAAKTDKGVYNDTEKKYLLLLHS